MKKHGIIAAAICVAAATVSTADEIESAGTGKGKAMNQVHQLGEGHMLIQMHTDYSSFEFEADGHPMTGMTGPCFGAIEINAGSVSGGGKCLYTDPEGDRVSMNWSAEGMTADGAMTGTWAVSGGTGKWMTARGAGTYASLTNRDTGENVNTVQGSISMP